MRRFYAAAGVAGTVLAVACESGDGGLAAPVGPSVNIRADDCVDARGNDIEFTYYRGGTRYAVDYSVDFTNTCSYAVDVHSVACYSRDGIEAPGHPNHWLYMAAYATERQHYSLGNDYEQPIDFEISVNYHACRAGNRQRCGRADRVCPP